MDFKLLILMTVLLLPLASAVSITDVSFSSSSQNGWWTGDVAVTATLDGAANITFTLQGSGGDEDLGTFEVTNASPEQTVNISATGREDNYTLEIRYSWREGNSTVEDFNETRMQIDAVDPDIDSYALSKQNASPDEDITITVNITEGFVKNATVGEKTLNDLPVTLQLSGNSYTATATPNELGCGAGECSLMVEAEDLAGNTDFIDDVLELTLEVTNQTGPASNFTIEILSPANNTLQDDSVINLLLRVTADDPPTDTVFCTYDLVDGEGSRDGVGDYFEDDFTSGNNVYTLNTTIVDVRDDIGYTLAVTCYDAQGTAYNREVEFTVQDSTSPEVRFIFSEITNTSVNFTLNGSEDFMIDTLEFRARDEMNATGIAFIEDFDTSYDFVLTNLTLGTEYVVRVTGIDREENEFERTEAFETLGGEPEPEENETTVYDVEINPNLTQGPRNRVLEGEEFLYGIDWIRTGGELEITVTNFDMNLRRFLVSARQDIRNVKIDVISSSDPPWWIDNVIPSNKSVFEYFQVDASVADDDLRYVKIVFEVSEIWLRDNDIPVNQIALFRYRDGEWNQLPTSLRKEGALLHTYEALSPGFSLFAVSAKRDADSRTVEDAVHEIEEAEEAEEAQKEPEQEGSEEESSGFAWYWWVMIFLGILVGILLVYYAAVTNRSSTDYEDHAVVKTHMKRLEKFVDQALAQGYDKESLRAKLVDNGWDARLVDFVLRRK